MKYRTIIVYFTIFLVMTCSAENDPGQSASKTTVEMYIDELSNHYLDGVWKKEKRQSIYHPNGNYLGLKVKYDAIPDDIGSLNGEFIFSNVEIAKIVKDTIWVNQNKPKDSKEDTYFFLLNFTVLAKRNGNSLVYFDKRESIFQYIILAKDNLDGGYKIIDFSPSRGTRNFIGARYMLQNKEKFNLSVVDVKKLTELLD